MITYKSAIYVYKAQSAQAVDGCIAEGGVYLLGMQANYKYMERTQCHVAIPVYILAYLEKKTNELNT